MTLAIQDHYADPILDDAIGRDVIIDNRDNSNDLEDYQIQVDIDDDQLMLQGERGIRFVDENLQILDYWEESDLNEWIEVSKIIGSKATAIRMLQKEGLSAVGNGDATFKFFDDFEGTSLDTNKWTEGGTGSISVSDSNVTLTSSDWEGRKRIDSTSEYGIGTAYHVYARLIPATVYGGDFAGLGYETLLETDDAYIDHSVDYTGFRQITEEANTRTTDENAMTADDDWHVFKIMRRSTTVCDFQIDDTPIESITTNVPDPDLSVTLLVRHTDCQLICDWLFVREYTSPEPTAVIE